MNAIVKTVFMSAVVLALALSPSVANAAEVRELTPENFDSVVGGSQGVLVEFFAPWCGHCKSLAPVYEQLAVTFKGLNVVIASVDADAHRELGQRYEVRGFPTLKWFPAGNKATPEEYEGGRAIADLVDFVNRKTGLNGRVVEPKTAVVALTESTFDAVVKDASKHVLVEFYAPWCGHCKKLEPDYEIVGASFEGEDSVVIAKLDADKFRAPATEHSVSGYPTILYFPAGANKKPETYNGGRAPADFVKFMNEKAGTERVVGGGLTASAGRNANLDAAAKKFVAAVKAGDNAARDVALTEAEALLSKLDDRQKESARFYVQTMKKISDDNSLAFVEKEIARLQRMVASGSVKASARALFHKRINIVKAFTA